MIYPVILAGGSGTRLWPVSRQSFPKQFACLADDRSLFQNTAQRLSGDGFAAPMIMTGGDFRFIVAEQLEQVDIAPGEIVIEPEGRNTAPAILTAALAHQDRPDALLLIAPSDHSVADPEAFTRAIAIGAEAAAEGKIVTFGILPERAETGYGYIEIAQPVDGLRPVAMTVENFVEKPDRERAEEMLTGRRHLWNAGIFLARVDTLLAAFEAHAPALLLPTRAALDKAKRDLCFLRLDPEAYARAEDTPIDKAVIEKAEDLVTIPTDCGWSDLGSWRSIWREGDQDASGNMLSDGAMALDCEGSLLRSEVEGLELVGLGLKNIAAIATDDAVLVADLDEGERIREVIGELKLKGAKQATEFNRCHRPWGYYETLSLGSRFQVKRIMVKPGAQLSLQSHVHRAEHWVVVEGSAKVTIDDEVKLITENQSTYIPLGAVHRLENPGKVPLNLIEVQSGAYLGEDDIIRYEDIYARAEAA